MKNVLNKHKYKIFLIIFIIGFLGSLALSLESPEQICDAKKGCDTVQNSKYAFTFGVKNSDYGILIFSILIIITSLHMHKPTKHKKTLIDSSIILGSIIAIYFIYLQQFVLKSYCKYCMVIDLGLLAALALLLYTSQKSYKPYTLYGP